MLHSKWHRWRDCCICFREHRQYHISSVWTLKSVNAISKLIMPQSVNAISKINYQSSPIKRNIFKWRLKLTWKHRKHTNSSSWTKTVFSVCQHLCNRSTSFASNLNSSGLSYDGQLFANEEQNMVGSWCDGYTTAIHDRCIRTWHHRSGQNGSSLSELNQIRVFGFLGQGHWNKFELVKLNNYGTWCACVCVYVLGTAPPDTTLCYVNSFI